MSLIALLPLFSGCSSSDDDKERGDEDNGEGGATYELRPSSTTLSPEAQEFSFLVWSDLPYLVSVEEGATDWLTILEDGSPSEGGVFESYEVKLYAEENSGSRNRSGRVSVLFESSSEISLTFTAIQRYESSASDGSGSGSTSVDTMIFDIWGHWTN